MMLEGQMVAGPTWGMVLFKSHDGRHFLASHHDAECARPYVIWEVQDATNVERIIGELEEISLDRMAETPTIDIFRNRHW